jgi:hypothetical protein
MRYLGLNNGPPATTMSHPDASPQVSPKDDSPSKVKPPPQEEESPPLSVTSSPGTSTPQQLVAPSPLLQAPSQLSLDPTQHHQLFCAERLRLAAQTWDNLSQFPQKWDKISISPNETKSQFPRAMTIFNFVFFLRFSVAMMQQGMSAEHHHAGMKDMFSLMPSLCHCLPSSSDASDGQQQKYPSQFFDPRRHLTSNFNLFGSSLPSQQGKNAEEEEEDDSSSCDSMVDSSKNKGKGQIETK